MLGTPIFAERYRAIVKEMVETNTTLSAGDCTVLAQKMAARLKAAGYPDSDLHILTVPDHPKEGSLVAVLPGSYLAREAQGVNPGAGRVRMALVAGVEECVEAAERIKAFILSQSK